MYYGQSLEDTAEVARARREFLQVFDAATKGLIKTIDNLYIEGPKFIIKSNREAIVYYRVIQKKCVFPSIYWNPSLFTLYYQMISKVSTQKIAGHFLMTS